MDAPIEFNLTWMMVLPKPIKKTIVPDKTKLINCAACPRELWN